MGDKETSSPPFPSNTGGARSKSGSKILACGLDTLILGYGINEFLNSEVWEVLKVGKVDAKAGGSVFGKGRADIEVQGQPFEILSQGYKGYEYVIKNADLTLMIAKEARGGSIYPEFYAQFGAEYLWSRGSDKAYREVSEFVSGMGQVAFDKVSRADLAVDLMMALPELDKDYPEVVSQSRKKVRFSMREYSLDSRTTGYWFGAGELIGRLYDKSYEAVKMGDNYMYPIWKANGWQGSPVSRLEFQVRRDKMIEFGVAGYADLRRYQADMWRYFTSKTLRVCEVGSVTNQSRWAVKDYWLDYQNAGSRFGVPQGILPIKDSKGGADRLDQQLVGCALSAFARRSALLGEEKAKEMAIERSHLSEEYVNSGEFLVEARKHINRHRRFNA